MLLFRLSAAGSIWKILSVDEVVGKKEDNKAGDRLRKPNLERSIHQSFVDLLWECFGGNAANLAFSHPSESVIAISIAGVDSNTCC